MASILFTSPDDIVTVIEFAAVIWFASRGENASYELASDIHTVSGSVVVAAKQRRSSWKATAEG